MSKHYTKKHKSNLNQGFTATNKKAIEIKKESEFTSLKFIGVLFFAITSFYLIVLVIGSYYFNSTKCTKLGNNYIKFLDKFK